MRYVLDSNVALKWVLPEPDSAKAISLRDGFRQGIHELLAPDVFPIEVAHSLAKAERRGIIPVSHAEQHLADVLATPPKLFAYLPLLSMAIRIASLARIGVYDCLYVLLADREGCELITADARLINSLGKTYPFITSVSSL
jgi:predicted nucleic acid-binding protein